MRYSRRNSFGVRTTHAGLSFDTGSSGLRCWRSRASVPTLRSGWAARRKANSFSASASRSERSWMMSRNGASCSALDTALRFNRSPCRSRSETSGKFCVLAAKTSASPAATRNDAPASQNMPSARDVWRAEPAATGLRSLVSQLLVRIMQLIVGQDSSPAADVQVGLSRRAGPGGPAQTWRSAPQPVCGLSHGLGRRRQRWEVRNMRGGEILARRCYVPGLQFLEAAQPVGFGPFVHLSRAEAVAQPLGVGQIRERIVGQRRQKIRTRQPEMRVGRLWDVARGFLKALPRVLVPTPL